MPDSLLGPPTITGPPKIPLTLLSFTAQEGLGQCFQYFIDVLSTKDDIGASDVVGQPVRVDLEVKDLQVRSFHGLVSSIEYRGSTTGSAMYRMVVRPWLWFLSRRQNCRIFQNLGTKDILDQVFTEHGGTKDLSALQGNYPAREYVVQYRESDLHFVTRLMESEGIYYYFLHETGKHTLVLVDTYTSHKPVPGYESLPFMPREANRTTSTEYVSDWSVVKEVQPGAYTQRDFDFTKANVVLESTRSAPKGHALDGLEVYDYPGGFVTTSVGDEYSRIRLEQLQVGFERATGGTNARGLTVGHTFSLTGHPRDDQNQDYLVVSTNCRVSGQATTSGGGGEQTFACSFTAIDPTTPFRTPSTTIKPVMAGPQTATVVGPDKSEICTDEYGRVKVQFHWDREGDNNEKSSCFVRVAQIWAGSGWGAVFTPRIGQEVIVDFLEGDPDQPIIVGRVHNSVNKPPYDPSKLPTVSGIRSHSSPKGGPANFNEIRFEDRKGHENFHVQAENTHTTLVKGNQSIAVGGDRSVGVTGNEQIDVKKDRTTTVHGDDMTTVVGDVMHQFDGMQTVKVGDNRIVIVAKDQFLRSKDGSITLVHGDSTINIAKGEDTTIVTKNASILVSQTGNVRIDNGGGMILMLKDGTMALRNTGGALTITQVDNTIELTDGKISIQANSEIEVKSKGKVTIEAQDKITIQTQDKVEVQAKEVDITGSQEVKIAAGGATVDLTASGATITAPMVKLN